EQAVDGAAEAEIVGIEPALGAAARNVEREICMAGFALFHRRDQFVPDIAADHAAMLEDEIGHCPFCFPRSRATRGSDSSFSILAASSKLSSVRNFSLGANLRPSRFAT